MWSNAALAVHRATEHRRLASTGSFAAEPPAFFTDGVSSAVHRVRASAWLLRDAVYHLDDAGYECEELNDCAAGVAALSAALQGRHVPPLPDPGQPMTRLPEPLPYSFAAEAAEEARSASRRYWAPGGAADRKYPVHKDVTAEAPDETLQQRRHRRQMQRRP